MAGPFVSIFGPEPARPASASSALTSLGTWGLPQMVQKFYAIKSGPAIKQGAIISTLFAVIVAPAAATSWVGSAACTPIRLRSAAGTRCTTSSSPLCCPPCPTCSSAS